MAKPPKSPDRPKHPEHSEHSDHSEHSNKPDREPPDRTLLKPNSDLWEFNPSEADKAGRRWTYTGREGTRLAGWTLTIAVTFEDEPDAAPDRELPQEPDLAPDRTLPT